MIVENILKYILKPTIFIAVMLFFTELIFAQSMIINGNANILIHDGGKLIFSNAQPNNIQKIGSLGGINTSGVNIATGDGNGDRGDRVFSFIVIGSE
jgi:hypothetical protein